VIPSAFLGAAIGLVVYYSIRALVVHLYRRHATRKREAHYQSHDY
jgi:hypothetical protein